MPSRIPDHALVGQTFGLWTVVGRIKRPRFGGYYWLCRCQCGNKRGVQGSTLIAGKSKCCGCVGAESLSKKNKTHGGSRTPEYHAWKAMRRRCENRWCNQYINYGGRGIKVCERWRSYENFIADVGRRPGPEYSLDRIDVNGHYEPGNIRWATSTVQQNNRRPRIKRPSAPVTVNEVLAAYGLPF